MGFACSAVLVLEGLLLNSRRSIIALTKALEWMFLESILKIESAPKAPRLLLLLAIFLLGSTASKAVCGRGPYVNHLAKYITVDDVFYNDGDDLIEIRWDGIGWEMLGPGSCANADSVYKAYVGMGYSEPPIRFIFEGYIPGGLVLVLLAVVLVIKWVQGASPPPAPTNTHT